MTEDNDYVQVVVENWVSATVTSCHESLMTHVLLSYSL